MKQIVFRLNIEDYDRLVEYEKIKGKHRYRLLSDVVYDTGIRVKKTGGDGWKQIKTTGKLYIRKGYEWDGATGVPDTDSVMRASLVHDALCELYHLDILNKLWIVRINCIFEEICIEDGMDDWLRRLYRWGLKLFWRNRR